MTPAEWKVVLAKLAPNADARFVAAFLSAASSEFARWSITEAKAVAKPESKPTTLEALDRAVSKVGPAAAAPSGSLSLNVAEGASGNRIRIGHLPD